MCSRGDKTPADAAMGPHLLASQPKAASRPGPGPGQNLPLGGGQMANGVRLKAGRA